MDKRTFLTMLFLVFGMALVALPVFSSAAGDHSLACLFVGMVWIGITGAVNELTDRRQPAADSAAYLPDIDDESDYDLCADEDGSGLCLSSTCQICDATSCPRHPEQVRLARYDRYYDSL